MLRSLLSASLLCSLSALASTADSARLSTSSIPIYHRLISLSSTARAPEYELRGVLHVDAHQDEAWLEETGKGVEELVSPSWEAGGEQRADEERYQIAVGEEEGKRQIIAVDACMLYHPATTVFNETLTLSLSAQPYSDVDGLRYTTSGKGSRSACVSGASREKLERGAGRLGGSLDVKVARGWEPEPIRYAKTEGAAAGQPVVVDEDGKIVPPAPPKGFFATYWIYTIPLLLVLAMGGGEEPAAK